MGSPFLSCQRTSRKVETNTPRPETGRGGFFFIFVLLFTSLRLLTGAVHLLDILSNDVRQNIQKIHRSAINALRCPCFVQILR